MKVFSFASYVDELFDLIYEQVVKNPEPFQVLIGRVIIPKPLLDQNERPPLAGTLDDY